MRSYGEGNGLLIKAQRYALALRFVADLIRMLISMLFGSVLVVLGGAQRMPVCNFGTVGRFFMMPGRRMFGGFSVVLSGMIVVFSSSLVVFMNCVLFHDGIPGRTILDTRRQSISVTMTQISRDRRRTVTVTN
jgi:hypothetical protein